MPGGISLSAEALQKLARHSWPGNVRELENTIQRAAALCGGSVIRPEDLWITDSDESSSPSRKSVEPGFSAGTTMREMERQLIAQTLEDMGGNRTRAAKSLGISLRTLRNKLNEFGLQDRQAKSAHSHAISA